jgi:hypothetical protein
MKKEICMLEFISKESRSNLGAFWKLAARSHAIPKVSKITF